MNIEAALPLFMNAAQIIVNDYMKASFPTLPVPQLEIDPNGVKYIRIVKREPHTASVYCFIEKATGNVLKAAGWKAPAKGARSNIFDVDNGVSGVSAYGAVYLR